MIVSEAYRTDRTLSLCRDHYHGRKPAPADAAPPGQVQDARNTTCEWCAIEPIVRVPARQYEDQDDCLAAAAADYASEHELAGWDLDPRWEDNNRDTILLTVPTR